MKNLQLTNGELTLDQGSEGKLTINRLYSTKPLFSHTELNTTPIINLLDDDSSYTKTEGKIISHSGSISTSTSSTLFENILIPDSWTYICYQGLTYGYDSSWNSYALCFYDSSNQFISGKYISEGTEDLAIPEDAATFSFACRTTDVENLAFYNLVAPSVNLEYPEIGCNSMDNTTSEYILHSHNNNYLTSSLQCTLCYNSSDDCVYIFALTDHHLISSNTMYSNGTKGNSSAFVLDSGDYEFNISMSEQAFETDENTTCYLLIFDITHDKVLQVIESTGSFPLQGSFSLIDSCDLWIILSRKSTFNLSDISESTSTYELTFSLENGSYLTNISKALPAKFSCRYDSVLGYSNDGTEYLDGCKLYNQGIIFYSIDGVHNEATRLYNDTYMKQNIEEQPLDYILFKSASVTTEATNASGKLITIPLSSIRNYKPNTKIYSRQLQKVETLVKDVEYEYIYNDDTNLYMNVRDFRKLSDFSIVYQLNRSKLIHMTCIDGYYSDKDCSYLDHSFNIHSGANYINIGEHMITYEEEVEA